MMDHNDSQALCSAMESGKDDENSYDDDEEARLQQERIDYLKNQRHVEEDDAAIARQFQDEELLQVQRENLSRQMMDEDLARRIHQEEMARESGSCSAYGVDGTSSYEQLSLGATCSDITDSIMFDGCRINVNCQSETEDEQLAKALQEQENEYASAMSHPVVLSESEFHDVHLAHIMQQSERISAMRRQFDNQSGQLAPLTSPSAFVLVQQPAGVQVASVGMPLSVTDEECFDGTVTLPAPSDEAAGRQRRKHRKGSCKQQ